MNKDTRHNMSWGIRLRMMFRFLGITALLAMAAGAIYLTSVLSDWKIETLAKALQNDLGFTAFLGTAFLFGGALVALFALLVEVLSSLAGGSGQRGATGINAAVQVAIAVAVVGAVNVYAFLHGAAFDLTSKRQFTLPENVVSELRKLKSPTTIVVLQQHKTFGRLSAKPDRYDYAAERKVVEKVKDLAEQFSRFGSQFSVVVLDVEEDDYKKKFDEVTKEHPALREAIVSAPENTIFFFSEGKVQGMSFNEFYQLDKTASEKAGNGKGNLVLEPQGINTLVKRITAIEEKRPKVAVAVTHPLLSSQKRPNSGADAYILAGFRKSLNDYGFDVVDVVLKKNYRGDFEGDPAAYTLEESQLMELESKLVSAKEVVAEERKIGDTLRKFKKLLDDVEQKPLNVRADTYLDLYGKLVGRRVTIPAEKRADEETVNSIGRDVKQTFESALTQNAHDLADAEDELRKRQEEWEPLSKNDRALEDRYVTDHKAKLTRLLADCDLLVIPRLTIMNPASMGGVLPRDLHKLDESQIEIIKNFMKDGKPVLVCAGPINSPFDPPNAKQDDMFDLRADKLETLLKDRGVELSRRTVLYNAEMATFKDLSRDDEDELSSPKFVLPSLLFTPPPRLKESGESKLKPNPIASAMEVLARSTDQKMDLQLRAPRPIRLSVSQEKKQGFYGEFLWTDAKSWDETFPFNYAFEMRINPATMRPDRRPVPRSRPRLDFAADDGKKGGEGGSEHRGPFSIAVSLDGALPEDWYTDKDKDLERKTARLAVIGHGGVFNGPELSPATEKLLLVVSNWLLKRDDRLPHAADPAAPYAVDRPWQYPRVELSEGNKNLWHWGTFLGLPALFIWFGLIVLMVRRVR